MNNMVGEGRTCIKCKEAKSLSEFYSCHRANGRPKISSSCKVCDRAKNLEYRNNNKEICRLSVKNWANKNKERVKTNKKNYELKKQYGLTLGDYNKILESQNGKCANLNCNRIDKRYLSVDHNHKTDEVRGLLCSQCNCALGLMDDDPQILMGLVAYLFKTKEK